MASGHGMKTCIRAQGPDLMLDRMHVLGEKREREGCGHQGKRIVKDGRRSEPLGGGLALSETEKKTCKEHGGEVRSETSGLDTQCILRRGVQVPVGQ